jgi:ParB family transcriptional regulator, chromosome partitioning protein
MTTSNAAVDKTTDKTADKAGAGKISEKIAEKRRALGRGLESLLPGPRVVPLPSTLPQSPRTDEAPAAVSSQFSVPSSEDGGSSLPPSSSASSSSELLDGPFGSPPGRLAGAGVAPADVLDQVQASASGVAAGGEPVFVLEMDLIDRNPYQTRLEFDEELLRELASSIQVQGVLQPISVRPGKDGRFILILGERRLRASRMAGKATIPAFVKRVSEQQAAEMTLVENLQRQDLDCTEQAQAFSNLSKKFNLTQEEIGKRAGVSREQVSNYMRLLALPESVIGALQKGRLTYSHARTLLHLRDDVQIWKYAQRAIEEKMSVAKLEDLVFGMSVPAGGGAKSMGGGARWVDPNVKAAQRSLEEVLGMKVRIKDKRGRGKILIEYATIDDFDRVVRMLKGK